MTEPCNEYRELLARNGEPYSEGHRIMYLAPIAMLKGKRHTILDVGFGIGYGLERMIEFGVIASYVGFEPCRESADYVVKKFGDIPDVTLINSPLVDIGDSFDFVFCIEVVEHLPAPELQRFLSTLRHATRKTLFLSTPDATKNDHGLLSATEWRTKLDTAGFDHVVALEEQWTTLFICQGTTR